MSIDITSLGIVVTSSGISEAATALDNLATAGAKIQNNIPAVKVAMDALSQSNQASANATEALMAKFQKQADLLGANTSQTNAYKAAMQGLPDLEQKMAQMLGAEVDAYKNLAKAQSEAITMNNKTKSDAAAIARDGQEYIASLKAQADAVGLHGKALKELRAEQSLQKASQLGVTNETKGYIETLKNAKGPHENFNLLTAGSAREMMVLIHEMSQGQFQRFGGSMIVMAERINFLPSLLEKASTAAAALGVSLGVLAGVVTIVAVGIGLVVYAAIKGAAEMHNMNNTLITTGNFAGITSEQMMTMAHSMTSTSGSIGAAKTALLELAASGKFSGDQMMYIAEAAVAADHSLGVPIGNTVKQFEKLADIVDSSTIKSTRAISKHAQELNDQYHYMDAATFERITTMEKEGNANGALDASMQAWASALKKRANESEALLSDSMKRLHKWKDEIVALWDQLGHVETDAHKIAKFQANIDTLNDPTSIASLITPDDARLNAIENNQKKIDAIKEEARKRDAAASAKAANDRLNQEQIHAQELFETITKQNDKMYAANEKLEQYKIAYSKNTDQWRLDHLKEYLENVAILEKAAAGKQEKVKGPGLTGLNLDEKNIQVQMQMAQTVADNKIFLIDKLRKIEGTSESEAATKKLAILEDERTKVTAFYNDQINLAANFHGKDITQTNEANLKKVTLQGQLMKFQSDNDAKQEVARALENKDVLDLEKTQKQAFDSTSKTLNKEIDALHDKHAAYMALPEAIRAAGVTEKQLGDLITQGAIDRAQAHLLDKNITQEEIDRTKALIKLYTEKQTAQVVGEKDQATNAFNLAGPARMKDEAAKTVAMWKSAGKEIETTLTDIFGNVGKSFGLIFKGYTNFLEQKTAADERYNAVVAQQANNPDEINKMAKIAEADRQRISETTRAQMQSYADMAGGAKSFFDVSSTGYKAISAVEKAFRAMELVEALKNFAVKTGLMASTAVVQNVVTAEMTTADTIYTAVAIANAEARAVADKAAAASMWAAVWPVLAAVGAVGALSAIFGGNKSNYLSAADQQKFQGTGSVLGDNNTQSKSIVNSLTILEKNSGLGLAQGDVMTGYMKNVSDNISALSAMIIRTTGITGTTVPGVTQGLTSIFSNVPIIGGILSKLFGTNTTVTDQGFTAGKTTLGQAQQSGINAQQYADVNTTKKFLGFTYSNSTDRSLTGVGSDVNNQIKLVIDGMAKTITAAADSLGVGGNAFTAHLKTFVIDIGNISLKGLSSADIQKQLEGVFSKLGDDMAGFALGAFSQFQKGGEGLLETISRVANDMVQTQQVFSVLGKTFDLTGVAAATVSENLATAAGSIDKLTAGTKYFVDNFLTEAEKMGPITTSVINQMTALGYSNVNTIEGFNQLVRSLDLTDPASQLLYTKLLAIAPAFKSAADYAQALADGTVKLTSYQQKALDAVNKERTELQKAYDAESKALQGTIDTGKAYIVTLQNLKDSMKLGADSPLTNLQKYAEAQKQFSATAALAATGDATAKNNFVTASTALLAASKVVNASGGAYTSDFNMVQGMIDKLIGSTSTQVDTAQASLDAMNKQVAGLLAINDSVKAVQDAIVSLQAAITVGGAAGLSNTQMGIPPTPAQVAAATPSSAIGGSAPITMIAPLIAAVNKLQDSVDAGRAEAAAQTGANIAATVNSNADNADTIANAVTSNRNYKLADSVALV